MTLDPKIHGGPVLLDHLPPPSGRPLVGAEVGILRGVNAAYLLEQRPDLRLYCVDDWSGCEELTGESGEEIRRQALMRLLPYRERAHLIEEDALTLPILGGAESPLDFAYLDADHSYEGTATALFYWSAVVKDGGILAGHDYGHPDYPGVKKAVDEFAEETGLELVVDRWSWVFRMERP